MGRKGRVCLRLAFALLATLFACPVEAAGGPGIALTVGEQGGLAAGLEVAPSKCSGCL